jgi:predicted secreted protein
LQFEFSNRTSAGKKLITMQSVAITAKAVGSIHLFSSAWTSEIEDIIKNDKSDACFYSLYNLAVVLGFSTFQDKYNICTLPQK